MTSDFLKYKEKKSQETYQLTYEFLEAHHADLQKVIELTSAWEQLVDLIPIFLDQITSFPTFSITEAALDAEYSRQICFMGFYKHAFFALRGALELGLLSIFWSDDKDATRWRQWIRSQEDTPRRREIIKSLFSVENIKKFSGHVNFEDEINLLYNVLSNFTHTKGTGYSSFGHNRANFSTFKEKSLSRWINLFERVTKVVCTVHLLKYPVGLQYTPISDKFGMNGPVGIFLEPSQSERIKKIFDEKTLGILQKISDEDSNAREMAEWVNQHPDITEEEMEKQIFEFDQFSIKTESWDKWSERELKYLDDLKLKDSKSYQKHARRYEGLKAWAKENNFIQ